MRILNPSRSLLLGTLLSIQSLVAHAELPDFTQLVAEASPAVVNISTTQKATQSPIHQGLPNMPDLDRLPPIFREFFERIPQLQNPNGTQRQQPQSASLGSGFIISEDGYVLTNQHVISGADTIIVSLADRRELEAKLIGSDVRTDVALLKIEGKNLPTLKLGNSEQIRVGEWVLAIGSPFGFDHSATSGIVSAKGRNLPSENYVPFIQTDVAINPGNSGGPLFNLKGEVIGINSQIFTRSGGFMGVSFAIPINVAMSVAEQLKTNGRVDRGWLGVGIQEVDKGLAESFGLDKPAGALIAQVIENGPAAKSGIQVGDVILTVDKQPIALASDLPHLIGVMKPGTRTQLTILRDSKERSLSLVVGRMPSQESDGLPSTTTAKKHNRLGITVANLTEAQKSQLDIPSGVIVNQVDAGPMAMIGLNNADVITHLNNQPVTSVEQFARLAQSLPVDRTLSMRILRQGRPSFISFKLSE